MLIKLNSQITLNESEHLVLFFLFLLLTIREFCGIIPTTEEQKIKNIFEKILDISFRLCYNIYRKKKGKDKKMKTIIQKIINFFSTEDKTYKVKFINYEGKEIETDMNVTSIQNLYNSGCRVISII